MYHKPYPRKPPLCTTKFDETVVLFFAAPPSRTTSCVSFGLFICSLLFSVLVKFRLKSSAYFERRQVLITFFFSVANTRDQKNCLNPCADYRLRMVSTDDCCYFPPEAKTALDSNVRNNILECLCSQ